MNEPVSVTEAIRGVLLAVIAALQAFDVWSPTPEQNAAVLAMFIALSVALSSVARSKTTPTSKVALTHDDVALIDATKGDA